MTRSQGQLLGVGVAVGLLGALAYALSKSAPAKSQGGGTGTVQPRDPWAALKTQINLLSLAGSNFNALAASSLPAGQRITAETNFLVAAANQIINSKALNGGVNVPPAPSPGPSSDFFGDLKQLGNVGLAILAFVAFKMFSKK